MGNRQVNSDSFRSGLVTIVGATNSGKSTLVNALIGKKISIVSEKPQTTRLQTIGVWNFPGAQILLQDTPGIVHPRILLEEKLIHLAFEALKGSDAILFLLDGTQGFRQWEEIILKHLRPLSIPVVLAINKMDLISPQKIQALQEETRNHYVFHEVIPISALHRLNLARLSEILHHLMPLNPPYYPPEYSSNLSHQLLAAETIREKILQHTYEEIPHSAAVVIDEFRQDEHKYYISAIIYVEEQSQRKILIGEKGKMAKIIGTEARKDLQKHFQKPIFLDLWVKVKKKWRRREDFLKALGY